MTEAILRVAFAGPHVSIQDQGRPGLMRYGVPASGPMDRQSFALANAALGNPAGHPGIEISLGGLSLHCQGGTITLALAGGGFIAEMPARKLGAWNILTLRAGETLTIRPGPWGSWTYLAIAGDLQAESWLGSRATHGSSGFCGGRLTTGQVLTITDAQTHPDLEGHIPCPIWARPRHLLRCTLGPQDRFFDAETLSAFTTARFEMTDAFDRMGLRLRGPALIPTGALSIPSEPILRGSVQVSGDGTATVLLSDHQTTGGYPKIATVLADDLDAFVQCRPRDAVMFQTITPAEAIAITRQNTLRFAAFQDRLRAR
ncbi:biotin-dependent carboxyltransferase family protein [Cypionkella sp.]|uniref:5-oxoprolinase subunit C family protein n=1 Tax=Cypionkella sp. TaxID=2811411 RepID=UPI002ABA0733|nr:biotin-dependent carboxyltransferase family protein [Cypionkella sp.]MDZ4391581.1 biotin-dependent carboxyltransferase family protein [Cypionkella sp.]